MLEVLVERRILIRAIVDTDDVGEAKRAAVAGDADEVAIESRETEAIEVTNQAGELVWSA